MTLIELVQSIPTTYGLSGDDAELFRKTFTAIFTDDWVGVEIGKKALAESDNPNAILALMAFNNHFLGRSAPPPVPYAAPTPEDVLKAEEEARALLAPLIASWR